VPGALLVFSVRFAPFPCWAIACAKRSRPASRPRATACRGGVYTYGEFRAYDGLEPRVPNSSVAVLVL